MANKQKLQELLAKLNALQKGSLDTTEIDSLSADLIEEEIANITSKIKGNPTIKALQSFKEEIARFKKDFDLQPIYQAIEEIQQEISDSEKTLLFEFEKRIKGIPFTPDLTDKVNALKQEFDSKLLSVPVKELELNIQSIQNQLQDMVASDIESDKASQEANEMVGKRIEEALGQMKDAVSELRKEFNIRIANHGGGNANRNITINGNSVLGRYTDVNFLNSSTIGWVSSVDDVNKRVNFMASILSGGGGGDLTVGTTAITGGTTTRILYDNAGILGEYTLTGTGTVVAMQTSPQFTTPTLGAALGTSLALGTSPSLTSGAILDISHATLGRALLRTTATNGTTQLKAIDSSGNAEVFLEQIGSAGDGFTYFGLSSASLSALFSNGSTSAGLAIGSLTSDPIYFGTNNTLRWTLGATGGMVGDTLALGGALHSASQMSATAASDSEIHVVTTSTNGFSAFGAFDSAGAVIYVSQNGLTSGGTFFGASSANLAVIYSNGASSTGMAIGAYSSDPLILGTNNTARMTFGATGQINLNTNLVAASTGSGTPKYFEVPALTLMTGANNTVIGTGAGAGAAITSGASNTLIGAGAGDGFATASSNTIIGHNAGSGSTMGGNNTAIGHNSQLATNDAAAAGNTSVGQGTLSALQSGANNTVIGYIAGTLLTTGSSNVLIGVAAESGSGTSSSIALGQGATVTASNQMAVGGTSTQITDVYWGKSVTNASPLAVTHNATGGSGTDIVGGSLILAGGKGTGTGVGGDFVVQTSKVLTTGTTLQTLGDRQRVLAKYTTLTESTDTAFASVAVGTGIVAGGFITYTVEANDGTDFQALTGVVPFTIVNKAGTLTLNLGTDQQSNAVSSGTLTGTLTLIDAGSGVAQFKMNAVSSLTQTVLRINAQVFKNFGTGAIAAI